MATTRMPTREEVLESITPFSALPKHLKALIKSYQPTWGGQKRYGFCSSFVDQYQDYHEATTGRKVSSARAQYILEKLLGGDSAHNYNYLLQVGRRLEGVTPEVRDLMWAFLDDGTKVISNVYQVIREARKYQKMSGKNLSEAILVVLRKEQENVVGSWSKKTQSDLEEDAVDHAVNMRKQEEKAARQEQRRKENGNGSRKKRARSAGSAELRVLRDAFDNFLDVVLNDRVPSSLGRSELRQAYQEDFKLLVARFKRAADHRSDMVDIDAGVDEARVIDACRTLEIDVPGRGKGFDSNAAGVAKAKFRRKSLTAHPDHGGSTTQFNELIDAFNLVQELHKTEWLRA